MNSGCRRRSGFEAKQSDENQSIKKPQLAHDHSQVVTGATQHCVDRIAQRTLESIAIELAVGLHVADGRLDRAATPDHCAQPARDTTSQAWVIDLHTIDGDSLVAAVDDSNLRLMSLRIAAYSNASASVCPSYGLPGIERAPTTRPSRCVVVIDTFTPNS